MKKPLALIAIWFIFAGFPAAGRCDEKPAINGARAGPSSDQNEKAVRERATELIDRLARADYPAAHGMFDPVLAKRMPPDKLRATWEGLVARHGPFEQQVSAKVKVRPTGSSALVTCAFQKRRYDARVVFNESGAVSVLAFLPVPLGGPGLILASDCPRLFPHNHALRQGDRRRSYSPRFRRASGRVASYPVFLVLVR